MNLDEFRKKINSLDAEIVRLLNERTRAALEIGELKRGKGDEVYVPAREKEVLERIIAMNQGPLPSPSLGAIYREIMSAAISLERPVRIAYLGPAATFTHQAARARFGASVDYLTCETIGDVFTLVEKKAADYGVVPIENSTDGAVTHTLDQFLSTPLKICAEIYLPISQNLMARIPKDRIRRIYSRGEVFAQCRRWLQEHMAGVELIPISSTARGAEMAAAEEGAGAIAGILAAELYGLDVLADNVQDLGGNTTRFLVVAPRFGRATGDDKTSVFFGVRHKVGALYQALAVFSHHGINMMKIESRPSRTKAWEYYFFVDIEGHAEDPAVAGALDKMREHTTIMTVLGSYPRAQGREG